MLNAIPLNPQEIVIKRTNIHVWIFVMPTIVLLVGIYLWMTSGRGFTLLDALNDLLNWLNSKLSATIKISLSTDPLPDIILNFLSKIRFEFRRWLSWIIMLWGLLKVYRACVSYFTTELIATPYRILVQTGLLQLRTVEMPNQQMDAFDITQNIPGRFLDFGTVIIHGTGGMTIKIPCLMDPFEFKNASIRYQQQ